MVRLFSYKIVTKLVLRQHISSVQIDGLPTLYNES